jgi:hypothetical protein
LLLLIAIAGLAYEVANGKIVLPWPKPSAPAPVEPTPPPFRALAGDEEAARAFKLADHAADAGRLAMDYLKRRPDGNWVYDAHMKVNEAKLFEQAILKAMNARNDEEFDAALDEARTMFPRDPSVAVLEARRKARHAAPPK